MNFEFLTEWTKTLYHTTRVHNSLAEKSYRDSRLPILEDVWNVLSDHIMLEIGAHYG